MKRKLNIKVGFIGKNIDKDKEGHFIMIKESIYQKYITTLNVYIQNNRIKNMTQN